MMVMMMVIMVLVMVIIRMTINDNDNENTSGIYIKLDAIKLKAKVHFQLQFNACVHFVKELEKVLAKGSAYCENEYLSQVFTEFDTHLVSL